MDDHAVTTPLAVVTGAAGDVGAATARLLVDKGWHVVLADIDVAKADAVAAELGAAASVHPLDLASRASVDDLAAGLAGVEVTAVVSCAALTLVGPFLDSDPDSWDRLYEVNLRGPMLLAQRLLPRLREAEDARLVLVSSDGARAGASGEAAYAATKAGVVGLAKCLARENARYGVTVNVVSPGPIDGQMVRQAMAGHEADLERIVRGIPMRRLARPDEVATAIAWLLEKNAGYITGQTLSVSGGVTMH